MDKNGSIARKMIKDNEIDFRNGSHKAIVSIDFIERLMIQYHKSEVKKLNLHGVMPRNLTAENGAKDLLRGEFVECFDPDNSGNPYVVPISWDTIKKIYDKIVSHYVA